MHPIADTGIDALLYALADLAGEDTVADLMAPRVDVASYLAGLTAALVDVAGYLACGCHSSQRDHTCGPLD